jgi:hypothetical protein
MGRAILVTYQHVDLCNVYKSWAESVGQDGIGDDGHGFCDRAGHETVLFAGAADCDVVVLFLQLSVSLMLFVWPSRQAV